MAVQQETIAVNPFTDPENRIRRTTSESSTEKLSSKGQALMRDFHNVATGDHKQCSCSPFCYLITHATQDSDMSLQGLSEVVHRAGYKKGFQKGYDRGYDKGYDKGYEKAKRLADEELQAARDQGWDDTMEHILAERARHRESWKEQMKTLEKRDIDEEDREWAEYLVGLIEPAKVTIWARRAKDAFKAKVGKGKGKEVVVDAEKEGLKDGVVGAEKAMSKNEVLREKIIAEREERAKARGDDPRCKKCGCRFPDVGGRCRC